MKEIILLICRNAYNVKLDDFTMKQSICGIPMGEWINTISGQYKWENRRPKAEFADSRDYHRRAIQARP
jgi:hypothetical protein